jgi:deoxyuridine 5'-triphosphate nucleotidohydrolase
MWVGGFEVQLKGEAMQIHVFRTHPDAKMPSRAHDDDACFDLFLLADANVWAIPQAFGTGIKLIIPRGYKVIFKEKSGKSLKGVEIHGGVIDAGYTGELRVIASCNPSKEQILLKKGEAICQFSIEEVLPADVIEIDEAQFLEEEQLKTRKTGGFGSTGR